MLVKLSTGITWEVFAMLDSFSPSALYNLQPINIGTPYVESLTGYIIRLADAHCIATGHLINKVFAPYLNKKYLLNISKKGGNGFYDSSSGINGTGKLAVQFNEMLNYLTGKSDLNFLTLQNFSNILPTRGLLKSNKAWCPVCYEHAKKENQVVYDQLIWCIQNIDVCPIHLVRLESACSNCNCEMPILGRKAVPGFCSSCLSWLGSEFGNDTNDMDYCLTKVKIVGEMLAEGNMNIFTKENLVCSIDYYIKNYFSGAPSKMAKYLEVPKSTFSGWKAGKNLPPLSQLVNMARKFNTSIAGFLNKNPGSFDLIYIESNEKSVNKRTYNPTEIQSTLQSALNSKGIIKSLSSVANQIGCDRRLLYLLFPHECKLLASKYSSYTKELSKKRLESIEQKFVEVTEYFISYKVYPSRRRVEALLDNNYLIKEDAVANLWNQLRQDFFSEVSLESSN